MNAHQGTILALVDVCLSSLKSFSIAVLWALMLVAPIAFAADATLLNSPAGSAAIPAAPWRIVGLPRQSKPFTRFSVDALDGQRVLRIEADASYGNLVHALANPPDAHRLSWRWRLDVPNPNSDLRQRSGDDSPIKVCAMFDLQLDAVPFLERQLLRVARTASAEPLPAASLCYVWDAHLAPGTVLDSAFSRRIRMIVVRGPEAPLRTWQTEQRDIRADFLRLFADEAQTVPPLIGIAIGADADNTQQHSVAHLATIKLD